MEKDSGERTETIPGAITSFTPLRVVPASGGKQKGAYRRHGVFRFLFFFFYFFFFTRLMRPQRAALWRNHPVHGAWVMAESGNSIDSKPRGLQAAAFFHAFSRRAKRAEEELHRKSGTTRFYRYLQTAQGRRLHGKGFEGTCRKDSPPRGSIRKRWVVSGARQGGGSPDGGYFAAGSDARGAIGLERRDWPGRAGGLQAHGRDAVSFSLHRWHNWFCAAGLGRRARLSP